jgi:hypothetical protein
MALKDRISILKHRQHDHADVRAGVDNASHGIDAVHNHNFAGLGMFDRISEFCPENNRDFSDYAA